MNDLVACGSGIVDGIEAALARRLPPAAPTRGDSGSRRARDLRWDCRAERSVGSRVGRTVRDVAAVLEPPPRGRGSTPDRVVVPVVDALLEMVEEAGLRPLWHSLCVPDRLKPVLLMEPLDMTTIFAVVGERRDDPLELLLLGEDGQHYAYPLPDGPALPVEPDEQWAVDRPRPAVEELLA